MFLNVQLVKGRPVVPPIEITKFHCLRPMQTVRTLEIRIILIVKFSKSLLYRKNNNNPYIEKQHEKPIYVKQQINININVVQADLQEEFPADSLNDLPALIESRIESIASLDA